MRPSGDIMVKLREATLLDHIFFFMSSCIFIVSITITFYAILTDQTDFSNSYEKVPAWANFIIYLMTLFALGVVEGLLIALVELKRQHPDTYRDLYPRAHVLGEIAARGDNVEKFLMGRQCIVTLLCFVSAKLSTVQLDEKEKNPLLPMHPILNEILLKTGLLACYLVTILSQLVPEILASKYPVQFLNCVIMKPSYYICVFIELTGVTHCCWLLVRFAEVVLRLKPETPPHSGADEEAPEPGSSGISSGMDTDSGSGLNTTTAVVEPTPNTPLIPK